MSYSYTVKMETSGNSRITSSSKTYTAEAQESYSISVANGKTDYQVDLNLDLTGLKVFYISSDQDVTVETNNADVPDESYDLIADVPLIFTEDSYKEYFLTDITKLYITNSSGSTATINIEVLHDVTPQAS